MRKIIRFFEDHFFMISVAVAMLIGGALGYYGNVLSGVIVFFAVLVSGAWQVWPDDVPNDPLRKKFGIFCICFGL